MTVANERMSHRPRLHAFQVDEDAVYAAFDAPGALRPGQRGIPGTEVPMTPGPMSVARLSLPEFLLVKCQGLLEEIQCADSVNVALLIE